MDRRTRFFWSLAIIAGVVVFAWEVYNLYGIRMNRQEIVKASAEISIGTDDELERVIGELEAQLEKREIFEFSLKNNPMKLNKVVFLTDDMGRLIQSMQANTIRVSGLYMNFDPPRATVEFQEKEHQVKVGDSLGKFRITRITENGVVAYRDGEAKFYPLQGRTVTAEAARNMTRGPQFDEEEDY
ncbi:MAG: hypothetical protein HQ508_05910 [Candidatus Marinimicrobia bacterium]|nr:hypothetical protein [Candidatus Neomarinimicrobiota bacterium]